MHRKLFVCLIGLWASFGVMDAVAADKPVYAPPPAWVQLAEVPKPTGSAEASVEALLDDNQSRLEPGAVSYYARQVARVAKEEGLRSSGSRSVSWDPATETVTLHALRLLRGGQVIDLLAGGKDVLVLRRESNLERAMLDGRLTATRQLEGLQVGDVIDWAYTRTRADPVVKGAVEHYEVVSHPGVLGRYRSRVTWPDAVPLRWRTTPGFPTPVLTRRDGWSELLTDARGLKRPEPVVGAPDRFRRQGTLDAASYKDWAEVSALMAPLYDKAARLSPDSAVRREAAAIAARSPDPRARAGAALALVQGQVRYLFLGMDLGGYLPASADETWNRRFGDCKAKTALLLALLRELKISAEPVLVNTAAGDGLNDRLPALSRFDHILIKAEIDGRTYWLDGTGQGDSDITRIDPPAFRWGLPVRAAGSELIAIVQPQLTVPLIAVSLRLDAGAGLDAPAPARLDFRLGGDIARGFKQMAASQPRDVFERSTRENFGKNFSWIRFKDVTWSEEGDGRIRLSLTGMADLDWVENADVGAREFRLPGAGSTAAVYPRREPGPNADAPYKVEHPFYLHSVVEVLLPDGGRGYTIKGPNLSEVVGGIEIVRKARLVDGVAVFEDSTRSQTPEVSAAEAMSANVAFRRLGAQPQIVRAPGRGG